MHENLTDNRSSCLSSKSIVQIYYGVDELELSGELDSNYKRRAGNLRKQKKYSQKTTLQYSLPVLFTIMRTIPLSRIHAI